MKNIYLLLIISAFTYSTSYSQGTKNIVVIDKSNSTAVTEDYESEKGSGELSIIGTSTLHDWESDVEDYTIKAQKDGNLINADFTVVVKSIKSGNSGMDKNTYKALKEESNPTITFKAKDLVITNNEFIKGNGNLTVAGKTRNIPINFSMASWVENTLTITGEIKINMLDYDVEPPVALFGTVKTGKDIVFKINTTLKQITN